jgi:hypothetical protein
MPYHKMKIILNLINLLNLFNFVNLPNLLHFHANTSTPTHPLFSQLLLIQAH